jgi:hypothetical protein
MCSILSTDVVPTEGLKHKGCVLFKEPQTCVVGTCSTLLQAAQASSERVMLICSHSGESFRERPSPRRAAWMVTCRPIHRSTGPLGSSRACISRIGGAKSDMADDLTRFRPLIFPPTTTNRPDPPNQLGMGTGLSSSSWTLQPSSSCVLLFLPLFDRSRSEHRCMCKGHICSYYGPIIGSIPCTYCIEKYREAASMERRKVCGSGRCLAHSPLPADTVASWRDYVAHNAPRVRE